MIEPSKVLRQSHVASTFPFEHVHAIAEHQSTSVRILDGHP
jgi:hypothetical protein